MTKYKVYKAPKKDGDEPVETYTFRPVDIMMQQLAMKYGPVVVVEEEEAQN